MYLKLLLCFFTEEKSDSSLPLYVLPLYSLLAPEKQAKVKDSLSQKQMTLTDRWHCCLKSHVLCELKGPSRTAASRQTGMALWARWAGFRAGLAWPVLSLLCQSRGLGEKKSNSPVAC